MAGSHCTNRGYKSLLTLLCTKRALSQSEKAAEPEICSQGMWVFCRNTSVTWQCSPERRALGDMAQKWKGFFATCHTVESESVWKKRISALLGEEASWSLHKTPNIKSHYAVLTPYCRSSTSKGYSTCQINLLYTNFYIQHKRKQICKTQLNPSKSQEPLLPDHEQEVIQRCQQDLYRYGWFTQTIGCTAAEQSCSVTFLSSQPSVRTRLMPRSLLVS